MLDLKPELPQPWEVLACIDIHLSVPDTTLMWTPNLAQRLGVRLGRASCKKKATQTTWLPSISSKFLPFWIFRFWSQDQTCFQGQHPSSLSPGTEAAWIEYLHPSPFDQVYICSWSSHTGSKWIILQSWARAQSSSWVILWAVSQARTGSCFKNTYSISHEKGRRKLVYSATLSNW